MPPTLFRTFKRRLPLLAAACLLAPALVLAQSPLDGEIREIKEAVRFNPEKALTQLQQIESSARMAPALTRGEFLSQLALSWRYLGRHKTALSLADELLAYAKSQNNEVLHAKGAEYRVRIPWCKGGSWGMTQTPIPRPRGLCVSMVPFR